MSMSSNQTESAGSSGSSFPKACPVCHHHTPELTGQLFSAIAQPCNHVFCYECAVTRELCTAEPNCPICQQVVETILVVRGQPDSRAAAALQVRQVERKAQFYGKIWYDSVNIDGELTGHDAKEFANKNVIYKYLKTLSFFRCNACEDAALERNLKVLKYNLDDFSYCMNHTIVKHNSYMCLLCFLHLKPLPLRLEQVSERELSKHMKTGTSLVSGFGPTAHAKCDLCKPDDKKFTPAWMAQWHWDQEELEKHLAENHVRCHLCPGLKYLEDQKDYAEHLELVHFECPLCALDGDEDEPQIFATIDELMDHGRDEHPGLKIDYVAIREKHLLAASQAKDAKMVVPPRVVPRVDSPIMIDYDRTEDDDMFDDFESAGHFVFVEDPPLSSASQSQPSRTVESSFREMVIAEPAGNAQPAAAAHAQQPTTAQPPKKTWANLAGGNVVKKDDSKDYPTLGQAADRSSITNRVTGGATAWGGNNRNNADNNNLGNWQQQRDGNNNRGFGNGNLTNGRGAGGQNYSGNGRGRNWGQKDRSTDASGFKGRGRGRGHK